MLGRRLLLDAHFVVISVLSCRTLTVCPLSLRKLGDGLFLQCCEEVAELYPKIKFDTMIIDNCCMQVRIPLPYPEPFCTSSCCSACWAKG